MNLKESRHNMGGFFIAGTDTDVGKTFVSALMVQALKHIDIEPYYYKPLASGGTGDIDFVRTYGELDNISSDCPIIFETPCSPHLASEMEERPFEKKEVFAACHKVIQNHSFSVIEGAGGTIVPLHRSGFDLHDLMLELNLPVILVTKTGVGTINHTLLTLEFMNQKGINVAGIVFNGYEAGPFEKDNIRLIECRSALPVVGVIPKLTEEPTIEKMSSLAGQLLADNIKRLINNQKLLKPDL